MPFRSLKEADLKPLVKRNLRTVPRSALALTLAAQVFLWGAIYVGSFTLLRALQKYLENYGLTLSVPLDLVLQSGEWVRTYRWGTLAVLMLGLFLEVFYFYRARPFVIRRKSWLLLMLFSLVLPFLLFTAGSFILIWEGLKIYSHLQ